MADDPPLRGDLDAEGACVSPDAAQIELSGLQKFLSDVHSAREQEEVAGREDAAVVSRQVSSNGSSSKRVREWGSMVDVEMGEIFRATNLS